MIRLSRAARERAIKNAIAQLDSRGFYKMHTKGEICRKMGIISTSKIRVILEQMAERGDLILATTAIDGFNHEVAIYGLPTYEQVPLPDHVIVINGHSMNLTYKEGDNYALTV